MFQMVVCDVKTRPDNDQVAFLVGSVPTLDFKNNHEGTLAALQQKLKQTETEKQNFRAQLNVVERKLADATDR